MCQLCPCPASPSRFNSRGEVEETQANYEEEEEEGGYCPPSPPAAVWRKTVVQPAPSHNGAPTFAAYQVPAITPETEAELRPLRPPFALIVYDTTHTARLTRSARLARALFDRTENFRKHADYQPDRVEIVTLPLPQSSSDDERVEACTRHHEEEFRSRLLIADKAEAVSWFLAERIMDRRYARKIIAVNCFEDDGNDDIEVASWEESLSNEEPFHVATGTDVSRSGSYLEIEWQPRKQRLYGALVYHPDYTLPDLPRVSLRSRRFEDFRSSLCEMYMPSQPFYNHFVPDGVFNRQLEEARKGQL
ncbi:ArcA-like protein [Colletotrichum tofieldiae]|uniref:ArcA-like protein n=1 Tax=Colletotrichum tofieldiae TaxID=708197 RepID=A0A166WBD6_9PEZI|nr:ArcA-like protein [Colletotrichum tofieldiae]